ncbi:MAG: hypothetical protein GF317_15810, partial [Candidatus Lokiarchaeota archaeon]|nr:hypothetical protein [Candidatus Lokiarchaeota archaeon]MBD3201016.1 hypothetical protein [Candidatus Lokiarchaeota archaeon]
MTFGTIQIVNGIFSLIFVVISLYVGLRIIAKYLRIKSTTLLFMGLTWIGITSPWWGSSISFIFGVFTGQGLSLQIYLFITLTPLPIFFTFYLIAITDLLWRDKQSLILLIYATFGLIFDVFYILFIFIAPEGIGSLEMMIDIRFKSFTVLYLILIIFSFLIFGVLFGKASLKSENPDISLQGKMLIIAFISFSIGSILDSSLTLNFVTLPITRLILISSALEFYSGFILPDWLKH